MKNLGRWSMAFATLALTGWVGLRHPPGDRPVALGKPSTGPDRTTLDLSTYAVDTPAQGQPDKKNWVAQFHAARSNYFEFVAQAARAAYEGDGAAQYYIGRALTRCEETNALYQDADSADQAVSHLAASSALLQLERREYLNCSKFRSENPFKDLPERRGGYPGDYWRLRAVESRYPVALVAAALDAPGADAPHVIATALATGNTEAMLLFGWSQATAAKAADSAPIMAAAWVLAACRSGANCGATNDVLPFATCSVEIELGCTERYTAVDELRASLGSQDFEEANLLALDIQGSIQFRDPERLKKYVPAF